MFKRMDMVHTMVSATIASSVTFQIRQDGAKINCCNFAYFNRIVIVYARTTFNQMEPNIIDVG